MNTENKTKFEAHLEHLGIDTEVIVPEDFEKFAELIAQECTNIVENLEQFEGLGDYPTAEYIKQRFGDQE